MTIKSVNNKFFNDFLKNVFNNKYYPYIIIAFVILIFNLIAVTGLNVLLLDDNARYYAVLYNQFPKYFLKISFFGAFTEWYAYKVMFMSPSIARLLYIILYMIPVSCFFYRLYNHYLGISSNVAIFASIIPNIITKQTLIPAFINGSYVTYGLLILLISLFICLKYLNSNKRSYHLLAISGISFFIFSLCFAEYIVFLFPPVILIILFYNTNTIKKIFIIFLLSLSVIFRIIWTFFIYSRVSGQPTYLNKSIILNRISYYFIWASPFFKDNIIFLLVLISILLFFGIKSILKGALIIKKPVFFEHLSNEFYYYFIVLFCITWIVSFSFVFFFLSKYFSVRYFYVSYFGFFLLVSICLGQLTNIFLHKKIKLNNLIFILLILIYGFTRINYLKKDFAKYNNIKTNILNQINMTGKYKDSQYVFVNYGTTGGWWIWSSGYIKYITQRNDLTSIMGPEKQFYNPFQMKMRAYSEDCNMNGLDLSMPIFLYKYNGKGQFIQHEYALSWENKTKNSEWSIYKFDKEKGIVISITSGKGLDDYLKKTSDDLKLDRNLILWGSLKEEEILKLLK